MIIIDERDIDGEHPCSVCWENDAFRIVDLDNGDGGTITIDVCRDCYESGIQP